VISAFFIRRPIVAIVIAIVTILLGAVSLVGLPIAQFPQIIPPQIILTTTFTGADAVVAIDSAEQALGLETALQQLESADKRAASVVELHYFAGLTLEQIAQMLELARRTIDRDWRFARAFLHDQLR